MQKITHILALATRITLAGSVLTLFSACGTPVTPSSSSSSVVASVSSAASSSLPSSSRSSSSLASSSSSVASVPSNLIINDNFDSAASGEVPPGWRTILGYGLVDFSRTPDAGSAAQIDSSRAHSGANSVKVSTPNAMAPHFIFQALPSGLSSIYVRAWVYSSSQLGGGAKGGAGDHAHFIGTLQTPGQDSGAELRFGPVQKAFLGGFMPTYGDSFTKSETQGSVPANTWTCVEWAVVDAASFDHMYAWVNGTQVLSAESASDWQNGPRADFVNANSTAYVSFGWRQFGSGANVSSIWFDDIAVGTSRIGCN